VIAALKTDAGNPENQDRGAIIHRESVLVLVVADGVGGRSGAAEAAIMAVEFVRKNAEGLKNAATCVALLHEMDHAIASDRDAGETTCTLAVVDGEHVFGATVGDSAAWVIEHNGEYTNLAEGQPRKPFVGLDGARPFSFSYRIDKSQRLLLATDGLLKYASPEQIADISCKDSLESSVSRLIELVRYPSGDLPDDITVILAGSNQQ